MLRLLDLENNPELRDLAGIEELVQLRELSLRATAVTSLDRLASLPRLRRLDLRETRLDSADLAPLQSLTALEELNLRESGVQDISPLRALAGLRYLNLHSNPAIRSIEPLRDLTRLQTLILRNVPIQEEITVIANLRQLQRLNIRNTGVQDLTALAGLMQQGALQDDPAGGVTADVDIRDNPVGGTPGEGPTGYDVLLPYWPHITYRQPPQLPREPSREVLINEVMTSNGSTLADADGDFPDWIELYNPGDEAIDLSGFFLSANPDDPFAWSFPDGSILSPGDFLLVFASGKDSGPGDGVDRRPDDGSDDGTAAAVELPPGSSRLDIGAAPHTSFTLSSGGTAVLLTAADRRTRVDHTDVPAIPRDTSWGRREDGLFVTYIDPTPGQDNSGARRYTPVQFSREGGFFRQPFQLELSSPHPEVQIYYTLDGSDPTPGRPGSTTRQYRRPLDIRDRTPEPNRLANIPTTIPEADFWYWQEPYGDVFKGTPVRAIAWDGTARSGIHSTTYFVHEDGADAFPMGVVSIQANPEDLFSYEHGIYVPGRVYDEHDDFVGNWMRHPANWSGRDEIPAHIEFYEPDGYRGFSVPAGVRIHGGFSRAHPLKSLRLYARKDYDRVNYFRHSVFPEAVRRTDHSHLTAHKRLMLRSGQSLFRSHLQDAITHDHVRPHVEVDLLHYRPVIHFINGEYWGIKNLRERFDRFFLANSYGIDPAEVIILEGPLGYPSQLDWGEPGEDQDFRDLLRYVEEHDMSDPGHYERVARWMDIDSFIDYNIVRIYSGDPDGVTKHVSMWRVRREYDPELPPGLDGRWRWHTWDLDNALMFLQNDMMTFYANDRRLQDYIDAAKPEQTGRTGQTDPEAVDPELLGDQAAQRSAAVQHVYNPRYTTLIAGLLQNQEFRHRFVNRFADLMNSLYRPDIYAAAIEDAAELLEPEMQRHIERWRYPASLAFWRSQVDSHIRFARQRPAVQTQHIIEYFQLRGFPPVGTATVTITLPSTGGTVRLNTITLNRGLPGTEPGETGDWNGTYFAGIPIEIEAQPDPGWVFTGWQGSVGTDQLLQPEIRLLLSDDVRVTPEFARADLLTEPENH